MRHAYLLLAVFLAAAAPPSQTTPVPLGPRPGTPLDRAARQLVAQDLAEAVQAGETPLVLIGTATLGSASDRQALFIQIQSARECGSGGCSTTVYLWQKGAYHRVLDGVAGQLAAGPGHTQGMADLTTGKDRYVWNGRQYQDAQPAPKRRSPPQDADQASGLTGASIPARPAPPPTSSPTHTTPVHPV